ncbi:MAG TPA: hypothetical protein VK210_18890 [Terriglobia bacterium]|nr:hypothetical protein [Terriglobia bacterium]
MAQRLMCFCFVLVFVFGVSASAFAAPGDCDRACLKTALDQYLNAVVTHNPTAAPLFSGFRQTENAVVVKFGTGVWKSVTGLGKMQRRFLDPVSGQAAYFGIVEEGAGSAIVTARIRVEDHKITEAEWYIARAGDPGLNGPRQPGLGPANAFNLENLIANPPPDRVVPKAARASREMLMAITNSYFDGITTHDGTIIMAHPGCARTENGTGMGGARGGTARGGGAATDCASGFANMNLQLVAARRYPVVDEEAQVVLAFAVFIRRPGSPTPRNAFSEWFFIDDNKIRSIYTAMFYPSPEQPIPNWPPYEGNWPLPAGIVPTPAAPAPR